MFAFEPKHSFKSKYSTLGFIVGLIVLAMIVLLTLIPTLSLAEDRLQTIEQQIGDIDFDGSSQKQEVVYAKLAQKGAIQDVYVNNIFENIDQNGDSEYLSVKDYGEYQSITNLSTSDTLLQTSDSITFTITNQYGSNFSYQGYMPNSIIPWNISIDYYLDGNPIDPSELGGKSGDFKLVLSISQNQDGDASYFENYLLEATISFPEGVTASLSTDDGSIAYSGSDIEVTFMEMPDSPSSFSLEANVTNFESGSIQIAAIPLSFALDLPDSDDITSQFDDLIYATSMLSTSAQQLSNGTDEITHALGSLENGIDQLNSASSQLDEGINSFVKGLSQTLSGAKNLNSGQKEIESSLNQLSSQGQQILSSLETTSHEITTKIDNLKTLTSSLTEEQNAILASFGIDFSDIITSLSQINDSFSSLETYFESVSKVAQNYSSNIVSGSSNIVSGLEQLDSQSTTIASASNTIAQNMQTLASEVAQLNEGSKQLSEGSAALASGTTNLYQETQKIPDSITSQLDEYLSNYDTSDFTPHSFVDDRNTQVSLVQFVMATDPIDAPEQEVEQTQEPQESLIDRFLSLFS